MIWTGPSRIWCKMNSQMNTFNQTSLPNNTSVTKCQARVWGDGSGNNQCSFSPGVTGLCTKHAKQEAKCCVPCTTIEDGKKRIGLFMGRINQWQDNIVGILPFKDENNVVRIIGWASPETFDAL